MRITIPRNLRHDRGFTMIEVLVVLAIVGILIATTLPTYLKQRPQRMLAAATNLLVANFNSARVLAIQNNQNVYMEFIPEVDTFRIWDASNWKRYTSFSMRAYSVSGFSVGAFSIAPLKTFSPLLHVKIYSGVPTVWRNLGSERAIGSDKVIPNEVDIRMNPNTCADQSWFDPALIARPTSKSVPDSLKLLSRTPLLFIVFHPDGSTANSWQFPCPSIFSYKEPPLGRNLGVTEIFLQTRGDWNVVTAKDYVPNYVNPGDPNIRVLGYFPNQSLATMYYEDGTPRNLGVNDEREINSGAMSESNGRRIIINNATGRVVVEDWPPYDIDVPPKNGEPLSPDNVNFPNRKHWL